jgi:hypothetical protein
MDVADVDERRPTLLDGGEEGGLVPRPAHRVGDGTRKILCHPLDGRAFAAIIQAHVVGRGGAGLAGEVPALHAQAIGGQRIN